MTPTQVVTLGLLAVAWLAIAFPLAMRTRSESLAGTVTGFHQAMSVLDPELKAPTVSAAIPHSTPRDQSATLSLLRRLFAVAVGSTLVLAVAAFMWGSFYVPLFVVSLLATGAYITLLRRRKVEQDRARAVITSIRDHADMAATTSSRRPESLPAAVGHQATRTHAVRRGGSAVMPRASIGHAPHAGPSGGAPYRSDVRVLSGHQRIQAYNGFDVLD